MGSAYRWVLKPLLFLFDPEQVHDLFISIGKTLGKAENTKTLTSFLYGYKNPVLKQNILGLTFENPVGLAAGFDKDANLMNILPSVGFGFEEIGSITAKPYGGNAKPRLTRLKKSKSLVVNYGLKSKGAEAIYKILKGKKCRFPIGTSIAKTNSLETVQEEKGIEDYTTGFKYFTEVGDYYTVNISCPNTFGGQPFHDSKMLDNLLTSLDKVKTKKPVFLKFSPDLSENQVDRILDVCKKHRVHGFVLSNLTKNRKNKKIVEKNIPEKGGLSGKVVEDLTDKLVSYVYKKTRRKYVIIGCGGIFSAEDAYRKIKNGASLVQLITGMIYEGPQLISDINLGLVKLLKKDGYKNISEAVGTTHLEKN
jgi:dihydroorotate dehydrogenase